jgi:hypothetical protein
LEDNINQWALNEIGRMCVDLFWLRIVVHREGKVMIKDVVL